VKKNEHEAFAALRWLRGDSYDVKDEIESIRQEMQSTEHEQEKIRKFLINRRRSQIPSD